MEGDQICDDNYDVYYDRQCNVLVRLILDANRVVLYCMSHTLCPRRGSFYSLYSCQPLPVHVPPLTCDLVISPHRLKSTCDDARRGWCDLYCTWLSPCAYLWSHLHTRTKKMARLPTGLPCAIFRAELVIPAMYKAHTTLPGPGEQQVCNKQASVMHAVLCFDSVTCVFECMVKEWSYFAHFFMHNAQ